MTELKEWLEPQLVWFVVGLVLLLLEFASPGVIILFFGVGAWLVALICLFVDISINLQLVIFIVSSLTLLIVFRKRLTGLLQKNSTPAEPGQEITDEFVGRKAVVSQKIAPGSTGKVEFRGTHWKAESTEKLAKGTTVKIMDKDNITLKVKSL